MGRIKQTATRDISGHPKQAPHRKYFPNAGQVTETQAQRRGANECTHVFSETSCMEETCAPKFKALLDIEITSATGTVISARQAITCHTWALDTCGGVNLARENMNERVEDDNPSQKSHTAVLSRLHTWPSH